MGGHEGILSMEINDPIDFLYLDFLFYSHSQYMLSLTIFNLFTFTHCIMRMKVCKSYHFQCMGYSQHPKIECPRFAKVNQKLTIPRGAYAPQISFLQVIKGDSTPHEPLCKFKQSPLGHFAIGSHAHGLKFVNSSKCSLFWLPLNQQLKLKRIK